MVRPAQKINLKWIIVVAVLMVAGLSGVLFILKQSTVPSSVSEAVPYPIYYPTSTPDDYQLDRKSFRAEQGLVLYEITKENQTTLTVTVQAKPNNFDFETFHATKLSGTKQLTTRVGQAYIGTVGNGLVLSVEGERTWLLLNAPSQVSSRTLEQIAEGLQTTE